MSCKTAMQGSRRSGSAPGTVATAAGTSVAASKKVAQSTCGTVMMPITAIAACHACQRREVGCREPRVRAASIAVEMTHASSSAAGSGCGMCPATAICTAALPVRLRQWALRGDALGRVLGCKDAAAGEAGGTADSAQHA